MTEFSIRGLLFGEPVLMATSEERIADRFARVLSSIIYAEAIMLDFTVTGLIPLVEVWFTTVTCFPWIDYNMPLLLLKESAEKNLNSCQAQMVLDHILADYGFSLSIDKHTNEPPNANK